MNEPAEIVRDGNKRRAEAFHIDQMNFSERRRAN
jgi:hypothetical protein